MSASETVAGQIDYMSKRLLEVAESSTVLDDFGKSKVGYKFTFKSAIANPNWIRIVRQDNAALDTKPSYSTYAFGRDAWDFGGFDFGDVELPLETRELSTLVRLRLEEELPF